MSRDPARRFIDYVLVSASPCLETLMSAFLQRRSYWKCLPLQSPIPSYQHWGGSYLSSCLSSMQCTNHWHTGVLILAPSKRNQWRIMTLHHILNYPRAVRREVLQYCRQTCGGVEGLCYQLATVSIDANRNLTHLK